MTSKVKPHSCSSLEARRVKKKIINVNYFTFLSLFRSHSPSREGYKNKIAPKNLLLLTCSLIKSHDRAAPWCHNISFDFFSHTYYFFYFILILLNLTPFEVMMEFVLCIKNHKSIANLSSLMSYWLWGFIFHLSVFFSAAPSPDEGEKQKKFKKIG